MNGNDGSCQLEGSHRDKEQKKMRLVGNSHPASTSTSTSTAAARSSQTLRSYAPMLRYEPETNRSRDTWDTQIDDHHWKMWWNYHTGKKEVTTPSSSSSFQCFFLWASLDAFGWFKIISFFFLELFHDRPMLAFLTAWVQRNRASFVAQPRIPHLGQLARCRARISWPVGRKMSECFLPKTALA